MVNKSVIIVVFCLLLFPIISSYELDCDDGLVSLYHFNNSGIDECGRNPATLINGANYSEGLQGSGVNFDGVDDYVLIGNDVSLSNFSQGFTFGGWFNTTSPFTQWLIFAGKGNSGWGDFSLGINVDDGWGLFQFQNSSQSSKFIGHYGTPAYNIGEWAFISGTYNGTAGTLYLGDDNNYTKVKVSSSFSGDMFNNASTNLKLGVLSLTGDYYEGMIDEFFILNVSLNESEIHDVANQTLTCREDWEVNYDNCLMNDTRVKYYLDDNNCGTTSDLPVDNGTSVECDYCVQTWECDLFDIACGGGVDISNCLDVEPINTTCCSETNLTSDCNYLSIGNLSDFNLYCGDIDVELILPSYPYVDLNTTFPMDLIVLRDNLPFNVTQFFMNLTLPNGTTLNFEWDWDNIDEFFELDLVFGVSGDYPFIIYALYPYDNIPEITGTFIVREPCLITIKGYETKNQQTKPYDNDFAYIIAEKTEKQYYDKILEKFITPLLFKGTFRTDVFHAPYIDGEATLKLWENDTNYAFRLIDGDIDFESTYSQPNITDNYDTNIFIDIYSFSCNGNDEEIRVLFAEHDIFPYRVLFNWVFIIGLGLIAITSIFLFFVIPQYSQISIIFGLGFTLMLVAGRVTLFLIFGW